MKNEISRKNNKKPNNSNQRRNRNNRNNKKPKETEINVQDTNINTEDLPHVITTSKKNNDPSWYTHIYPLVGDYASLPFAISNGLSYEIRSGITGVGGSGNKYHEFPITTRYRAAGVTPGIMTFTIMPSIGVSDSPTSAPNIAAQQIYTLDRKANSGAVNYDKTDVMMTVVAMDSAYMLYEELLRVYRILGMYNYQNRYLPNALLESLGFSSKLTNHYSDLRGVLDQFAYQLGAVNIPDQFDFIHRHSWLFTNVYKDSESSKAQLYAYLPGYYYVWQEGQNEEPTILKLTSRSTLYGVANSAETTTLIETIDQIQTAINNIMIPILGSQDIGTISGDLAKAFGESGMIKISPVIEHEALNPIYSPEVIEQMSNASVHRLTPQGNGCDIRPNLDNLVAGPYLEHVPSFIASNSVLASIGRKHLLNYRMLSPSPENNMVATRLINTFESDRNKTGIMSISSCGTEIVTDCKMWYFPYNTRTGQLNEHPFDQPFEQDRLLGIEDLTAETTTIRTRTIVDTVQQMIVSSKFDNCPTQYIYSFTGAILVPGTNNLTIWGHVQDDNEYTMLDRQTIENLNDEIGRAHV